jgi:hypothetical protein
MLRGRNRDRGLKAAVAAVVALTNHLLLLGDMQSGTIDALLLEGDMNSGTDDLAFEGAF